MNISFNTESIQDQAQVRRIIQQAQDQIESLRRSEALAQELISVKADLESIKAVRSLPVRDDDRLITKHEAFTLLNCKDDYLQELKHSGLLPYHKQGKKHLYRLSDCLSLSKMDTKYINRTLRAYRADKQASKAVVDLIRNSQ